MRTFDDALFDFSFVFDVTLFLVMLVHPAPDQAKISSLNCNCVKIMFCFMQVPDMCKWLFGYVNKMAWN